MDVIDVVTISTKAVILRNRGYKFKVHKLKAVRNEDPNVTKWERVEDEEGEFVLEDVWFKFTNSTLAEIELPPPCGWDGIEQWGEELEKKPLQVVTRTLAIVEERYIVDSNGLTVPDWKYGGMRMQDGQVLQYMTVMMGAMQMAQGADPERTGETVKKQLAKAREELQKQSEQLSEEDESDTQTSQLPVSPSNNGSPDGAS